MIYLIQDAYIDENDNFHKVLKIGYTSNIDSRISQYTSHNFGFKLLKTREGDEELEKLLHYHFNKYLIKESHNREWFEYNDEIINEFEKLEKEELSSKLSNFNKRKKVYEEKITDDLLLKLCKNNLDLFSEIRTFLNDFNINKNFERRIKSYCIFLDKNNYLDLLKKIPEIPSMFHLYYELLGPKIIKSKSYKEKELTYEVKIHEQNPEIRDRIIVSFIPDHKYSNKDIKIILQNIYSDLGLKKVAKAGDINEYLLTERTQFIQVDANGNKKKVEGLKIIGLK